MDGPLSFFDIYGWPPSFLKLMDGPFGRKRPFLRKKRRKNQLSETGPFRLILKLVDGPFCFLTFMDGPPSFLKLMNGPFGA